MKFMQEAVSYKHKNVSLVRGKTSKDMKLQILESGAY